MRHSYSVWLVVSWSGEELLASLQVKPGSVRSNKKGRLQKEVREEKVAEILCMLSFVWHVQTYYTYKYFIHRPLMFWNLHSTTITAVIFYFEVYYFWDLTLTSTSYSDIWLLKLSKYFNCNWKNFAVYTICMYYVLHYTYKYFIYRLLPF